MSCRGSRQAPPVFGRFPGYSRAEHGSRIPGDKCNCSLMDKQAKHVREKNTDQKTNRFQTVKSRTGKHHGQFLSVCLGVIDDLQSVWSLLFL